MTTPTLLRVALLGALGLATGCAPATAVIETSADTDVPDPGPCGEHPRLTAADVQNDVIPGEYKVCVAKDPGQTCAPAAELQTWTFLSEALGPHPEPDFCGWYGEDVCGPTPSGDDECCYVMFVSSICEGRPLLAEGAPRLASTAESTGWNTTANLDLAELQALPEEIRAVGAALWTDTALAEHASVASFARASLELISLGAPAGLLLETARAQADEVRHAAQAFAIASGLAGRSVAPGPLPLAGVAARTTPAEILTGLILEGCVNESLAAAEAREAARCCTSPTLAAALETVADDETRHAALAWRSLRWLLDTHPELLPLARQTLSEALEFRARPERGVHPSAAARVGGLTILQRRALADSVVRTVLRPLSVAVLGAPESVCPSP
jgi:hypothetical protein